MKKILSFLFLLIIILIPSKVRANESEFDLDEYLNSISLNSDEKKYIRDNIDRIENNELDLTYELFGAKGDGVTNDSDAIKYTHDFANLEYVYNNKMIEVKGTANKIYYISLVSNPIQIATNVDWRNCTFIIDDGAEGVDIEKNIFDVVSKMNVKVPNKYFGLNPSILDDLGIEINQNTSNLSDLIDYLKTMDSSDRYGISVEKFEIMKDELNSADKYLIEVINSKKKIGKRYNSGLGESLKERFVIDKNGKVLNDIFWDFDEISSFRIYPIYEETISIKNAKIITRTNNVAYTTEGAKTSYVKRNIFISSSNIKVENISHFIDEEFYPNNNPEYQDRSNANTYNGIIETDNSSFLTFNNIKLFSHTFPHSLKNGKINPTGTYGTYDMSISNSVNINLNNIGYAVSDNQTEEEAYYENMLNTDTRWSSLAMNSNKDMLFNNCILNTISSHQGTYNITINNSHIGKRGIILMGGGNLIVNDVVIDKAGSLLKFHDDYGATWNGSVYLNNVKYILDNTNYSAYLINTNRAENWDFGYSLYFPSIYINNLEIDDTLMVDNKKVYLIGMRESQSIELSDVDTSDYYPYYMGSNIELKNVNTTTDRGISIFSNHFINSHYLEQSRYRNNGEEEKTDITIYSDVLLHSSEDLNAYNVDDGQFNVNLKTDEYYVLEGENQTIDGSLDLIFRISGDLNKFKKLFIDENFVDKSNYTLSFGSTIVTISKSYLSTLKNGVHTITFVYEDGEVSTTFTLKNNNDNNIVKVDTSEDKEDIIKNDSGNIKNPNTFDNIKKNLVLLIISTLGMIIIVKK